MCHWVGFSGRSVWDSMQIARGSVKQLGCHVSQFISLLKSVLTGLCKFKNLLNLNFNKNNYDNDNDNDNNDNMMSLV